jgi:hypothetical protein
MRRAQIVRMIGRLGYDSSERISGREEVMEEEWKIYLRDNDEELYNQMRRSVRWAATWRDEQIDQLFGERDALKNQLAREVDDFTQSYTRLEIKHNELQAENVLLREALKSAQQYLQDRTSPDCFTDWYDILENYERIINFTPETAKVQAVLDAAIDLMDGMHENELIQEERPLYKAVREMEV